MQNDFAYVVQWIFAQVQNVLSLISNNWILKTALFVPIAGVAILFVFYFLQDIEFTFPFLDRNDKSLLGVNSYAFGSIHSRKFGSSLSGKLRGAAFNNTSIVKLSTASHGVISKKRRKAAEAARDKKREDERNKWRQEWQNKLKVEQASRDYYNSNSRSNSLNIDVN